MNPLRSTSLLPISAGIVGAVALLAWWGEPLASSLPLREPAPTEGAAAASLDAKPKEGTVTVGEGTPSALTGIWPAFRGSGGDNIVQDGVALARSWADSGPPRLWSIELGEGHAGAAVRSGRIYVMDYDRANQSDALRCLSLDDGREIWTFSYPVEVKRNHGMSRTVPTVTEDTVVAIGPKCHVYCVEAASGKQRWIRDLVVEDKATVPPWYAGQCPLVDEGSLILAPGGDSLVMAVDLKSGEVQWKSPNPRGWTQTHVSVIPMEVAGEKMYVYCGRGGVAGVSAKDGRILWETTDWKISIATVPSPVVLGDGKLFFCGGYNAGALILSVRKEGDGFVASTVKKLSAKEFGSTQQTPILWQDHLYGIRERDKQLVCMDLEGNEVWASGAAHQFGIGPYLLADGLLYVLDDDGWLTLAEASPEKYTQLAKTRAVEGHDAWAPMAMVEGRLILRDLTQMVCLDVSRKEAPDVAAK